MKVKISHTFLLVLLLGCDSGIPTIKFTSEFPHRKINLSKKVGNSFSVLQGVSDTLPLLISYDKQSKVNYIINESTKDTLLQGYVSKYHGVYFLSKKKGTANYDIIGFKVKNDSIYGFVNNSFKMTYYYQRNLLRKKIMKGSFSALIAEYNQPDNTYYLKPDKKVLKSALVEIMEALNPLDSTRWFKPLLIIDDNDVLDVNIESFSEDTILAPELENETSQIIRRIFPNPVQDYCNIEFAYMIIGTLEVLNSSGQIVFDKAVHSVREKIDLSNLKPGNYIITVSDQKLNNRGSAQFIKS